jgi:hypothetical protein
VAEKTSTRNAHGEGISKRTEAPGYQSTMRQSTLPMLPRLFFTACVINLIRQLNLL